NAVPHGPSGRAPFAGGSGGSQARGESMAQGARPALEGAAPAARGVARQLTGCTASAAAGRGREPGRAPGVAISAGERLIWNGPADRSARHRLRAQPEAVAR